MTRRQIRNHDLQPRQTGYCSSFVVTGRPFKRLKAGLIMSQPYTEIKEGLNLLSLSALLMTDTELKLMAAAAIMGLRSSPNTG